MPMDQTITAIIQWLAPILSTVIIAAATASINMQVQHSQRTADERHAETEAKRKAEAEWRDALDRRLDHQDSRIEAVLKVQCSQTRSDIIHKCHRYLDDLGRASTEEKAALHSEHQEYAAMCEANDIVNSFVDKLVERVMQLPEREI